MGTPKTQIAAKTKLLINDVFFGIATGLEFTSDPARKSIGGIDQLETFEISPTATIIQGRIDVVRLRGDGGLEGRGVAAPLSVVLFEKYISITLVDRESDQVIFRCDKAVVGPQTWSIRAKKLIEGNFQFQGISWYNESAS